ncbi:MAG: alpha/beta hydrolase [Clostridium sp.]|uniref:alpha/beta fold hydrolase n=1 Tax=Clostridium sp. TaxID=1506 RepID=UPI0025C450F2|nr:alpha/beta hydrolase [Clostridium sp.]MCF0148072.1 alpha/beta hydrolase [Clostridium sp.]
MKLLPHSNGLYKVNMKKELDPKEKAKKIITVILVILVVGFIYQRISNFITKETLKERVDYVRVEDKRLDYRIEGEGKYTIVFDGNIGTNLNQWSGIADKLLSDYGDVSIFTYNRRGYGFSDSGSIRTPKEQAEDLRTLLRKAAIPSPYILVGEEYGSLVLTEFAKAYPDLVAGVVLVNPLVEDEINSDKYQKSLIFEKIRRNIESIGSEIGLTTLLDKVNLACNTDEFEKKLDYMDLEEFKIHRTKSSYNKAVNNELKNITSGNNSSQEEGIFSKKPYYLIAKPGQEVLSNLGDEALTKVYSVDYEENIVSMYQPDTVITGIRQVIKQANEIDRLEKKNHSN